MAKKGAHKFLALALCLLVTMNFGFSSWALTDVQDNSEAVDHASDKAVVEEQSDKAAEAKSEGKTNFVYENADMKVKATLSKEGIIPDGASFVVKEKKLSKENEAKIEKTLEKNEVLLGSATYDIHFEKDGKEVEPKDGTVKVSMEYKKAKNLVDDKDASVSDGEFVVYHLNETKNGVVAEEVSSTVKGDDGAVEKVQFTADSFSDYTYVYKGKTYSTDSTDTYESLGGKYDLQHFTDGYQVLAFGDMNSTTHMMGAALIQGTFTTGVSFSDGANLPPSYVGNWTGTLYSDRGDSKGNGNLYLGSGDLTADGSGNVVSYTLDGRNLGINKEDLFVYKNPNFFDFDRAQKVIDEQVKTLQDDAAEYVIENPDPWNVDTLKLPAGDDVKFDKSLLNKQFNWGSLPNNINVVGDLTETTAIVIEGDGEIRLPNVDYNGSQPSVVEQSDEGAGIMWVFPDATDVYLPSSPFIGHIIAPNATVHTDGNYNGTIICKDFECHNEGHVYRYTSTELPHSLHFDAEGNKTVNDKKPGSETFQFVLAEIKDGKETVLSTVENDADGNIKFDAVKYPGEGTHKYKIYEVNEGKEGVTYDASYYLVNVKVEMQDGHLAVTEKTMEKVAADGGKAAADTISFANKSTKKETAKTELKVAKNLELGAGATNAPDINGKFTFTLEGENEDTPMPATTKVTNKTGEAVSFGEIEYSEAGTYKYTITETGSVKGVENDSEATKNVVVEVTEDEDGKLVATVKDNKETTTFTNTYKVTAAAAELKVAKELELGAGATNAPDINGKFTFTLTGENEDTPMPKKTEITNKTGEAVSFGKIEYKKAGTYKYTITETGSVKGVENDQEANKNVVVEVKDDGEGKLVATVKDNKETTTFTNTYKVTAADAELKVAKELKLGDGATNAPAIDGKFTFTLNGENEDTPMPATTKVTNKTGEAVSFGKIEYKKAGTYKYTITETGSVKGVENDLEAIKNVVVEVKDDGEGKLVATVKDDKETTTFTNTYKGVTAANAELKVAKDLQLGTGATNAPDINGKFTFTLKGETEDTPMPATTEITNKTGEAVSFGKIEYKKAGTYKYTITETGSVKGVENDSEATKNVVVEVTEDEDGKLVATVKDNKEITTFTNTYKVTAADAELKVAKELKLGAGAKNAPDINGKFTFTLKGASEDTPMPKITEVTNKTGEAVSFGKIEYTKAGTYNYTITETGSVKGVENDQEATKNVVVEVKDDGEGKLVATVKDDKETTTFTNTYKVTAAAAELKVAKDLDLGAGAKNAPDINGKFTFTLKGASEDTPMPKITEVTNKTGEAVSFGKIEYKKAGTYNYTITETGSVKGVENDQEATKNVVVEVKDDGEGKLVATVKDNKETTTFTNTYKVTAADAELKVAKELKLGESAKNAPAIDGKFTFTLKGETEDTPMPKITEVTNKTGEAVSFGKIEYTKAGTYNYTITETGSVKGVENDQEATKTVVVEVKDDGEGKLVATVKDNKETTTFTNTYKVTAADAELKVAKELELGAGATNAPAIDGKFTFTLKGETEDTPMPKTTEVTNKTGEAVSFGKIEYKKAGTYKYTITETGSVKGVENDQEATKNVVVEVKDDGEGKLVATVKDNKETTTFTNTYKVSAAKADFAAKKDLTGRTLKAGEFSFELYDVDADKVVETKKNAEDGTVNFSAIEYTAEGTHNYIIREVVPETKLSGVKYDTHEANITVTVADNGEGKLVATKTPGEGSTTFSNKYSAAGSVTLELDKSLTGRNMKKGEFNFTVKEGDEVVATGSNDSAADDGKSSKIKFSEIKYSIDDEKNDVGTHTYTVTEDETKAGGVKRDTKSFTVTVEVTDNGDGTLKAVPTYPADGKEFKNTYTSQSTEIALEATKKLEGRALNAGEFSFKVTENGETVATGTNDAEGNVEFTKSPYGKTGTHHYTVSEIIPEAGGELGGVTYDETTFEATVEVTDDGEGHLVATATYPNGKPAFKNNYEAKGSAIFEGTKFLEGRSLDEGEFSFVATEDGEIVSRGTNDADGKIKFSEIEYTLNAEKSDVGTHTLVVSEVPGDKGGVEYSNETYTITITVSDNGDGTLSAEVALPDDGLAFHNGYEAAEAKVVLGGKKTLTGAKLKDGQFSFELKDESGEVVQTVKNDANGNFAFDEMKFTEEGEFNFTVSEVKESEKGVIYDKTIYAVKVTVTDDREGKLIASVDTNGKNLEFTNKYKEDKKKGVKTGDDNNAKIWGGMMFASAVALAIMALRRRKKSA